MGQYGYEIYLTHMFIVFPLFVLFVDLGKQLRMVPALFIAAVAGSGLLGMTVARIYSEPMNQFLRSRARREARGSAPVLIAEAAAEDQVAP